MQMHLFIQATTRCITCTLNVKLKKTICIMYSEVQVRVAHLPWKIVVYHENTFFVLKISCFQKIRHISVMSFCINCVLFFWVLRWFLALRYILSFLSLALAPTPDWYVTLSLILVPNLKYKIFLSIYQFNIKKFGL